MKEDGSWDTFGDWRLFQYMLRTPNKGTARKRIICEQEIICKSKLQTKVTSGVTTGSL